MARSKQSKKTPVRKAKTQGRSVSGSNVGLENRNRILGSHRHKHTASPGELEKRTTEDVFLDHLELRKAGRLEEDIARNYAEDVIIVSNVGTFFGHAGVRQSAGLLRLLLPTYAYKFDSLLIHKNITFEEWEAETDDFSVNDGIDAFVIKDGKIRVQTIYYLPEEKKRRKKRSPSSC